MHAPQTRKGQRAGDEEGLVPVARNHFQNGVGHGSGVIQTFDLMRDWMLLESEERRCINVVSGASPIRLEDISIFCTIPLSTCMKGFMLPSFLLDRRLPWVLSDFRLDMVGERV